MAAMPSLAASFLSYSGQRAREPATPATPATYDEPLERALSALVEAGCAAWPRLAPDADQFIKHLAQHASPKGDGGESADIFEYLSSVHAADLWLASACARGDPQALAAFDEQFLADVPSFLARANQPSDAAEEARQGLRERLFVSEPGGQPRIASYSGRGPLWSWVRVAALRFATTLHRKTKDHAQLAGHDVPADLAAHDPELQILQGRHGQAVPLALRDAFLAMPSGERALLRLHFLDGLNLERLGLVFQVSRATAGRMMLAARERLLEDTLALLRERLRLESAELESLLGALRSKLDVSLHALLKEP